MRKTKRNILSAVLTLALLFSVMPLSVYADPAGSFTIEDAGGGALDSTDYDYTAPVLEIKGAGDYIVTGSTTTDRILISGNANVTLNNVDIDVSGTSDALSGAAIRVTAADATIILQGTNTL